eukprot:CAMPEP_0117447916 /NCGR_PEP_ID=MMETSP0759-20121206/7123_1 /TAXON_ID=63605 /ORGANISM="Percolomonas cosmopolitus, Strain WS" /LENGTH=934 /DNA_ID=CAMNT_0005240269 /DNA_START=302 /DNA_END=3103 /DNA_ORIENTATION=+
MQETIQTYLRIRPVPRKVDYQIESTFSSGSITFRSYDRAVKLTSGDINNSKVEWQYKFNGIMDIHTEQQDVFERVAKDCVLKAMDGYNATIFAYGQTGSGKTWSITGGHGAYEERGLLQRAISLVYDEIEKRSDKEWTVRIQFIEVYNGKGYDLLGRREGKSPTHLGDLQKAVLRDDQTGVAVLCNVKDKLAGTEDDALNCLFEGDSNRVMCATSQNPNSSRSHVVFTMQITSMVPGSSEAQVSKLNIVDLAGSERFRVYDGTTPGDQQLHEAKSINGSLFCLEQCIQALSQKQDFVPYRNSFITSLLKDSIGGNCKTVMLATINPDPNQFAESMSTCKFAMRVASIKQVARKNTVVDPFVRIRQLKKKIKTLKERLAFYENGEEKDRELDANERAVVLDRVREFVASPDMDVVNLGGNFGRVQEAFRIFRSLLNKENITIPAQRKYADETHDDEGNSSPKKSGMKTLAAPSSTGEISADIEKQLKNLQSAISLRDIEIDILVSMITKKQQDRQEAAIQTQSDLSHGASHNSLPSPSSRFSEVERAKPTLSKEAFLDNIHSQAQLAHDQASPKKVEYRNRKLEEYTKAVGMMDRAQAFEQFRRSYRKNEVIERCKQQLKDKFAEAKDLGSQINSARIDIGSLKGRLIQLRSERAAQGLIDSSENKDEDVSPEEQDLIGQIRLRKEQYNRDFESLKEKKKEIQFLNKNLDRSRVKLQQDFEKWFQSTDFTSIHPQDQQSQAADESNFLRPQHAATINSTSPKSSFSSSPRYVSSFSPKYRAKQAWEESSAQPASDRSSFYESVRSSHERSPRNNGSHAHRENGSTLTHDNLRRLSGGDSYSDRSSAFESVRSRHHTDYGSGRSAGNGFSSSHMSTTSSGHSDREEPGRSSTNVVSGLNPNNPLLQKLAGYMKMSETVAQNRPSGNDNRRSLLSRA